MRTLLAVTVRGAGGALRPVAHGASRRPGPDREDGATQRRCGVSEVPCLGHRQVVRIGSAERVTEPLSNSADRTQPRSRASTDQGFRSRKG